jgi:uncharacterized protein (DUF736 family)
VFVAKACILICAVWLLIVLQLPWQQTKTDKGGILSKIEVIWKKPWFGKLLLVVAGVALLVSWLYPIPAGYSITAIAVVAATMALREREMGGWERWLWFIVILFLAATEIRAINRDRRDQNDKFEATLTRLETTIQEGRTHYGSLKESIAEATATFRKRFPPQPVLTQSQFANITNERLIDMTKSNIKELTELRQHWEYSNHNAYMRVIDPLYGDAGARMTPLERKAAFEAAYTKVKHDQAEVGKAWKEQSKDALNSANSLRKALFGRLTSRQKAMRGDQDKQQDKMIDDLFAKIAKGDYDFPDLDRLAAYLDSLWKLVA